MAKKTKDSNLSIEERLEQALIPNWDEPYKLPENWCWTKIGMVTNLYRGVSYKKHEGHSEKGINDCLIMRGGNIKEGVIDIDADNIYVDKGLVSKEQYVKKHDIIIVSSTGSIKVIGRAGISFADYDDVAFGAFLTLVRPIERVYKPYISYYFQGDMYRNRMRQLASGVNINNIRNEYITDTPIPLPPLNEQKRIVSHIEFIFAKLDEAKEKAQEVVDGFEARKAAILHKAFSGELTQKWRRANDVDSFAFVESIDAKMQHCKKKKTKKSTNEFASTIKDYITSEWTYVDLDRISKIITDGEHKTPRRVTDFKGYYLLSARNIHNDLLLLEDVDYVDEIEFATISKRCNPKRNDLLISCSGSVGRCCVIEDNNNYVMVRSAAMVSLLDGNPRFAMYMLQSDCLQEQIKKLSKQTAQANLFLGAISALIIPFPDIKEQNEIVRIVEDLFVKERKAKEMAEESIEQINTIKKAVLARAFRGELGTNDPSEESALELLKSVLLGNTNQQEPKKSNKKSTSIPNHIETALFTKLEKKIVSLFYTTESKVVSVDEIMSVSSKKIDIIDTLTKLEQRGIIIRLNNSYYCIKE